MSNQFTVNSTTANDQSEPKVIALNDGRLMLVWTSDEGGGSYEIRGRIVLADGTPVDRDGAGGGTDADFVINSFTTGPQEQPSIAVLGDGRFVATWYSNGEIRARVFDANGFPVDPDGGGSLTTDDFVVNTTTVGLQHRPSVAALADGGYVITWQTAGASDGLYEVYSKAFSAANVPATANDVHVSSQTGANQNNPVAGPQPTVAGLTDGNYVVTWQYGANGTEVLYRILSPAGAAITATFQANPPDGDFQGNARVTALQNGRFALVWSDEVAPGDFDIWVRTYDSGGLPYPTIFRANDVLTGVQGSPAITQLSDGRIAVAWRDDENVDGISDINVRILNANGQPADLDGNGAADGDIVINTSSTSIAGPEPGIVGLPNGGFAVTWKSGSPGDIQARTFSPIVANNDSVSVPEDTGLLGLTIDGVGQLLRNDTYAGGLNSLTVQAYTAATAHGTVSVTADGAFIYSPNANYVGSDSFTYTVTDGVFRATATVNVTVHSLNDPPVAGDDSVTVAEDGGATTIDVLGNDSSGPANENQTLTVTAVTQPVSGGTVTLTNGVVSFTPNANFAGTTSFTYTVSDGGPDDGDGSTDTATVTVTVNGSPDAPVANAVNATGAEDAPSIEITLTGSDADAGDAVETFTVSALPADGTLYLDAGLSQAVVAGQAYPAAAQQLKLYFVPTQDFFGTTSFGYTANDGGLDSSPATATITVTAENDLPDAAADNVTVQANSGATVIDVLNNDSFGPANENQTLTITEVTQPVSGGTVTLNGGVVGFTPAMGFSGSTSFSYKISDGAGGEDTATVTVIVTPETLTANDDPVTVAEDSGATVIDVLANDTIPPGAGATLTITGVTQPANGAVSVNGTAVRFTPAENFFGSTSFDYTISDGNGGTDTGTVTVTVTPTNDPPAAVGDTLIIANSSGSTLVDVLANDTLGVDLTGALSVTGVTQPVEGGSVKLINGVVHFTPASGFVGNTSFGYTLSDGEGGTATGTVSVTVTPNTAPTAQGSAPAGSEDAAIAVALAGQDADSGDAVVSFRVDSLPANGTLYDAETGGNAIALGATVAAGNGGATVWFRPNADWNGTTSFAFSAFDGDAYSASAATVNITVAPVDDAVADNATVAEDGAVTIDVLGNDEFEGSTPELESFTQGDHGVVTRDDGGTPNDSGDDKLIYTPDDDYVGSDTFEYTVASGGVTETRTVNVTVTAENDQPDAVADSFTVGGRTTTVLNVLGNDRIAPDTGETLTVTAVTQPASGGTVTLTNGVVRFSAAAGFTGETTFDYTISDGNGGTDTASVTVTVLPPDTLTVTTLNDELDSSNANASLADFGGAGDLSLREALVLAQQDPDADIITFAPGLSRGKITLKPTLEGRGGNLFIAQAVTIDGDLNDDGVADITIDGGDAARLFYIDTTADAELVGLTLQNGLAKGGNAGSGAAGGGGGLGAGGAIFVAGGASLHVEDVLFGGATGDGNQAIGGNGSRVFGSGNGAPGGAGSGGPAFGLGGSPNGGGGDFGGGGAGGFTGLGGNSSPGGNGGFGGGAGGGGSRFTGGGGGGSGAGMPGFGGGSGRSGYGGGYTGGGGGGAGLGGAMFVQDGASVSFGGGVLFENNSAVGGLGGGNGSGGSGIGTGLFLQRGGVTFTPAAGETVTVRDTIADATDALNRAGTGSGSLTLDGEGTLILVGGNTYTGATTVNAGTLQVDGSIASSPLTIQNGGTVGGTGQLGAVTVASGGTLAPGASPGILKSGSVSLASGAAFEVELAGTTVGTQYDQLQVTGSVSLGGATLVGSLTGPFTGVRGNTFVIIDNDGTDAVSGTFAGLAEGSLVRFDGWAFAISYQGGTGNDVVITRVGPTPAHDVAAVTENSIRFFNVTAGDPITGAGRDDSPDQVLSVVSLTDTDDPGAPVGSASSPVSAAVPGTIMTDLGATVTLQSSGLLQYDVTAANGSLAFNKLAAGQTAVDTFSYKVVDGQGLEGTATVSVTITGVNDPIVAVNDAVVAIEDDAASHTGDLVANDIDVDDQDTDGAGADTGDSKTITHVVAGEGVTAAVPTLDGWTLTLGSGVSIALNRDGTYQMLGTEPLAQDQVVSGTFNYTVQDAGGVTSTASVSVNVTGRNDATAITIGAGDSAEAGRAETDAGLTASGTLTVTDIDVTDTVTASVQSLAVSGTGAAELPGGLFEATLLSFLTVAPNPVIGTLTWSFDSSNEAFDFLSAGKTLVLTYTVRAADSTTFDDQTVTVTITGRNDAPVGADDTAQVDEGATVNGVIPGVLANDTDVDAGAVRSVSAVNGDGSRVGTAVVGTYGTLTLNADGSYSYVADQPAADGLASGATATDTFSYTVSDGTDTDTVDLVITVTGVNDNAPVAVGDAGAVDENATLNAAAAGVLANDTDADPGDPRMVSAVNGNERKVGGAVVGTYGTLTLNADGSYSYVADQNAADSLASGVTATDTFGYTIFDGIHTNTAALVITVTGINDNAPVAVDDTGVVDENATLSVAGVLANDTDADPSDPRNVSAVNGAALNVGAAVAGTYGTLTLNGDGSYSYVADQADALAAGVTVTDTFSYTVSDGLHADTADLVITVKGVNDAPVAGVPAKLTPIGVNSGAHLITQATLLVNATDVDGSPLTAIDLQIAKGAGTLVDNHDGTWTYTPKINDDTDVTFSFLVSDGVAAPVAASATLDIEPTQSSPEIGTPGDDSFTAVTGNSQYNAGAGVDTIAFNFRLVDAVVTWSGHQVIIDGPSSHTVLSGFEIYQFSDGTVNNNDGSPLIDDLFYNAQYHDVWNAQVDADFHYNATGWKEGRDPSAFFDTGFYLTLNPDVRAAGINPLTHYDTTGWKEGRLPSLEFGTQQYLEANPDVKAAQVDPLFHFLAVGASEGRQPIAPSALLAANGFDLVYYLRHNPDVAAAHVDPLQHFQTVGWKEGRDPNASFDTDGYLAAYADVRTAGVNPFDHYNQVGWHEGRDPSVNFDTGDYLAANPDVAAAGVNPLLHFLALGIYEGRSSHADGVWG